MYNEKEAKHYGLSMPSGSLLTPNFQFIISAAGVLNLLEVVGSSVCIGVLLIHCQPGYQGIYGSFLGTTNETFFLMANFGALLCTALIFLTSLISMPTAAVLSRTILGIVFSLGMVFLCFAATIAFFLTINVANGPVYQEYDYNWKLALSILSMANTSMHGVSSLISYRSCRRSWS